MREVNERAADLIRLAAGCGARRAKAPGPPRAHCDNQFHRVRRGPGPRDIVAGLPATGEELYAGGIQLKSRRRRHGGPLQPDCDPRCSAIYPSHALGMLGLGHVHPARAGIRVARHNAAA